MQPRYLLRPFLYSLGAFVVIALAVGAVVLPREINEIRHPHTVTIDTFVADERLRTAFIVYRIVPERGAARISYRMGARDLGDPLLKPVIEFPGAAPNCLIRCGEQVLAGELDGTLRRYTPEFRSEIVGQQQPGDAVAGLACSPDGRLLISWGESLYVWDLSAKKLVRRFPVRTRFALLPAGSQSFVCEDPATQKIVVRDLESGELLHTLADGANANAIVRSPDGNQIAWTGSNGSVCLADVTTGQTVWTSTAASSTSGVVMQPLDFNSDGSRILCLNHLGTSHWALSIWNAADGTLEKLLDTQEAQMVGAQFTDRERFYAWSTNGHLYRWDLQLSDVEPTATWDTTDWQIAPP